MARRAARRGGGLDSLMGSLIVEVKAKRQALLTDVERLDGILTALGQNGSRRRGGRSGPRPIRDVSAGVAGRRGGRRRGGRRGKRGAGWSVVEGALKRSGGKGTTTDLKTTWANLGSRTPLSVALASYVRSGRLRKSGSGRGASYSLAKGG